MHRINREGRNDMKSIRIDLFTNLSNLSIYYLSICLSVYLCTLST